MQSIVILLSIIIVLLVGVVVLIYIRNKRILSELHRLKDNFSKNESLVLHQGLEGIKYKMNPHLFKNILNSIQSHAYQTYYSLDKLSNVLDYILYESDKKFVSVQEEVEFALSLIEINKLKLSPLFDLQIKNKIDESNEFYKQAIILPLITVDLIENAFKHTDIKSENSFISITFELKDTLFSLTVANKISNQPPIKKSKGGIGKENTIKRLELVYKDSYTLDQFVEKDIYISHLKINLIEYKNKVLITG